MKLFNAIEDYVSARIAVSESESGKFYVNPETLNRQRETLVEKRQKLESACEEVEHVIRLHC